jgi:hypothetical protein
MLCATQGFGKQTLTRSAIMQDALGPQDFEKTFAKLLTAACFRRGELEGLHAGIAPATNVGDYSDVYVVDATGQKIPWTEVSRIDQAEMKSLMIGTVNRVYTFLARTLLTLDDDSEFEHAIDRAVVPWVAEWAEPSFLPDFLMREPLDGNGRGAESKRNGD